LTFQWGEQFISLLTVYSRLLYNPILCRRLFGARDLENSFGLTHMDTFEATFQQLRQENEKLKQEVAHLKNRLQLQKERQTNCSLDTDSFPPLLPLSIRELTKEEIHRYGRQLILKDIGVQGQKNLIRTSVILVGAGGLCASAAFYLAGAGVGRIGIVDYDVVEVNNLHRQIIHTEEAAKNKTPKAISAKESILRLNPAIECIAYDTMLTRKNALNILNPYDIVVDCTDNVVTRYLLNDCCVFLNKPLVSGSALRMEGQLTVYHYNGGPCYRCLFPKPPPPESVTSCSDGGVLGVVAGIIGCLEALETIKIALQLEKDCVMSGKLLLFDATTTSFRTVKLRPRDKQCAVCGDTPTIKELIDYEGFCNATATDKVVVPKTLPDKFCISTKDYKTKVIDMKIPHILLDVREPVQYAICALPNSINIPLRELEQRMDELKTKRNENSPQSHALPSISIPN